MFSNRIFTKINESIPEKEQYKANFATQLVGYVEFFSELRSRTRPFEFKVESVFSSGFVMLDVEAFKSRDLQGQALSTPECSSSLHRREYRCRT